MEEVEIHGMAHITGGGLAENLQRIMPPEVGAVIDSNVIDTPAIFNLIARLGNVPKEEMYRTFNMGVGYVLVIPSHHLDKALKHLCAKGEKAIVIGDVTSKEPRVIVK
jgi:phosphoribosylformylglycinamidine cyclo-ligase